MTRDFDFEGRWCLLFYLARAMSRIVLLIRELLREKLFFKEALLQMTKPKTYAKNVVKLSPQTQPVRTILELLCTQFGRLVYCVWCSIVFFSQQFKSPAAQNAQDTKVKTKITWSFRVTSGYNCSVWNKICWARFLVWTANRILEKSIDWFLFSSQFLRFANVLWVFWLRFL